MFRKIIAWTLLIALTATAAVGGTLAYLTDRDSEANVFTVGDVKIDLTEDFDQGATLIPGVDIKKEPTVTNIGPNDAWIWAEIAIPSELNSTATASKNIVHFNMSAASVADGLWNWWDGADYSEGTYFVKQTEIDGVQYDLYTVQYETALKAGETTAEPLIYKVYLDPHVDVDPDGNWAWIEDGVASPINWNSTTNGNPIIYVSAYAMQTENFGTVYDAYDAYQTQWGDNGKEWATPAIIEEVKVTADDIDSIDFTQDNARFVLSGEFTNDLTFDIQAGLNQVYDASGANFVGESTVTINAPGVAHAYSSLNAERKGIVTVTGFEVQTLNVLAYNNEAVTISNNKVNSMSVIGGNFKLILDGNLVDGNFGKYTDGEGQSNDYGISMRITDYELTVTNNTVTDAYSHAIGINGRQGEVSSDWGDCGKNNKIVSFSGNNITVNSTQKTERAALKIWCDQAYAPYATSGHEPNATAKALMNSIKDDASNVIILTDGHTTFNIFDYKA